MAAKPSRRRAGRPGSLADADVDPHRQRFARNDRHAEGAFLEGDRSGFPGGTLEIGEDEVLHSLVVFDPHHPHVHRQAKAKRDRVLRAQAGRVARFDRGGVAALQVRIESDILRPFMRVVARTVDGGAADVGVAERDDGCAAFVVHDAQRHAVQLTVVLGPKLKIDDVVVEGGALGGRQEGNLRRLVVGREGRGRRRQLELQVVQHQEVAVVRVDRGAAGDQQANDAGLPRPPPPAGATTRR